MLGLVCGVVACVFFVWGLGDHGFWTDAELPVLDRSRAALGAALGGLDRSPWLPDALRTAAYALFGGELGARLPHALAASALVGLAAGLARARGFSVAGAALAGGFVLAFPAIEVGGRTLLGNPIGELTAVLCVVLGLEALRRDGLRLRIVLAALGLGALALSVASTGLLLGAALPLFVLAIAAREQGQRKPALALGVAALGAAIATLVLVLGQEDGYIPILAAAKDLAIADEPQSQPFTAGLEALGVQVFPWLPLAIVGVLDSQRDRWPALWLLLGLVVTGAWALVYGYVAVPIAIPVALCCAQGVLYLTRESGPSPGRRLALVLVIGGMLIMGKDAERAPARIASPLVAKVDEKDDLADDIGAPDVLERINRLGMLAVLLAYLLAPGGRARRRIHIPEHIRRVLAPALVGGALAHQAVFHGHVLVPRASEKLSPRALLARHRHWVESGDLPERLVGLRARDQGLDYYGPSAGWVEHLDSRPGLVDHLAGEEPAAALISTTELSRIHHDHLVNGWPLHVLDCSHGKLMLVANVLPEGASDHNPIADVLYDAPVPMAHETLVEFDGRVQIIGWQIEEPVMRGRKRNLELLIRVLKPLSSGAKIFMRLQQRNKLSRVTADWHEPTDGVYPPHLWREGDYIVHRHELDMPMLEILPGEYDLIVALGRSKEAKYEITIPEGKKGELGVQVRDRKRNHATIGRVQVW